MSINIEFKINKMKLLKFFRYACTIDGYRIIERHMKKATYRNGLELAKQTRAIIKSAPFQKNARLTVAIKRSEKPLIHTNQLFRAITAKRVEDLEVFVGVLRTNKRFNIAEIVHGEEGKEFSKIIPVTPKMRTMFYMLYKASVNPIYIKELRGRAAELWSMKPGGWTPIPDNKNAIKIPSRPFMEMAIKDEKLVNELHSHWIRALDDSFREIKRKIM